MDLVIAGLIAGLLLIYLGSLNWKLSVKAILYILVLEGIGRKWAFPQLNELIFFLKDFILLGAYVSYFFNSKHTFYHGQVYRKQIIFPLALFLTWATVNAFNPALGSPIIGLFGLKNYLIYIPLIWLVPNLFDSKEQLYKFLRTYLILIIPMGVLGIIQFFSSPFSPINTYANETAIGVVSRFGNERYARITGTFSYIGTYQFYLLNSLCFLLPLIKYPLQIKSRLSILFWEVIIWSEVGMIILQSFMTGSRTTVLISLGLVISFLFFAGGIELSSLFKKFFRFFLPLAVASFIIIVQYPEPIIAFTERLSNQTWEESSWRITRKFEDPVTFSQGQPFGGYGTGAAYQAVPFIRKVFRLPQGEVLHVSPEVESGRIMIEIGWLGFILWYIIRLLLLFLLWQIYCKLKHPFLRQIALSLLIFQSINLTNKIVFHHVNSFFHWFSFGIAFLLPKLDKIEEQNNNR